MVGLGSSNKKVCVHKIPPDPLLSRFESQRNIVVTVHVQSGTVVHTPDFIIVYYCTIHTISTYEGDPAKGDTHHGKTSIRVQRKSFLKLAIRAS